MFLVAVAGGEHSGVYNLCRADPPPNSCPVTLAYLNTLRWTTEYYLTASALKDTNLRFTLKLLSGYHQRVEHVDPCLTVHEGVLLTLCTVKGTPR